MGADVVVAGAGPAGAAAAYVLASAGADVLLLERARFPRDKTCGDGLTPHAIKIFQAMGLEFEAFGEHARRTYGGLISGPGGGMFCADPPPDAQGRRLESWVVPRSVLDAEVSRCAVRAGARLQQGTAVCGLVFDGHTVTGVEVNDGSGVKRVAAKAVIGADGAHSAVAKALGLKENPPRHLGYALRAYYDGVSGLGDDLEIHYYSKQLLPGYGWIFPLGGRRANVGVGIYVGELRRSDKKLREILDDFIASVPCVAPRFSGAKQVSRPTGWPLPVSSVNRRTVFDGAMLAGDAASLVDPLTGEGIYTALVSGQSAARAALRGLQAKDVSRHLLSCHEREWKASAGGYLSAGRVLKNLAKSAWLFDLIVALAAARPQYASRAIGYGLGTLERRRALRSIVLKAALNPAFFRLPARTA